MNPIIKLQSFLLFVMLLSASIISPAATKTSIFAMGCFWCAEHDMEKVPGVIDVTSGYTGGNVKNPSYKQVSNGATGHLEAIKVTYNDKLVSYATLLDNFFRNIDPTDSTGQFCDKGYQYRAAIFYANKEQETLAKSKLNELKKRFGAVSVLLLPAKEFYHAESYHQDYASKNPVRYNYYRYRCGRDDRLKEVWGEN